MGSWQPLHGGTVFFFGSPDFMALGADRNSKSSQRSVTWLTGVSPKLSALTRSDTLLHLQAFQSGCDARYAGTAKRLRCQREVVTSCRGVAFSAQLDATEIVRTSLFPQHHFDPLLVVLVLTREVGLSC